MRCCIIKNATSLLITFLECVSTSRIGRGCVFSVGFGRRFFILGGIKMKITTEMYTKLFSELTNIQDELQRIIDRTKEIQIEVEEMYISQDDNKI